MALQPWWVKLSAASFTLADSRHSLLHHKRTAELGDPSRAFRNSDAVERCIVGSNDLFRFQHDDRTGDSNRDHVYRLGEYQYTLSTHEYTNTRKRDSILSSWSAISPMPYSFGVSNQRRKVSTSKTWTSCSVTARHSCPVASGSRARMLTKSPMGSRSTSSTAMRALSSISRVLIGWIGRWRMGITEDSQVKTKLTTYNLPLRSRIATWRSQSSSSVDTDQSKLFTRKRMSMRYCSKEVSAAPAINNTRLQIVESVAPPLPAHQLCAASSQKWISFSCICLNRNPLCPYEYPRSLISKAQYR